MAIKLYRNVYGTIEIIGKTTELKNSYNWKPLYVQMEGDAESGWDTNISLRSKWISLLIGLSTEHVVVG